MEDLDNQRIKLEYISARKLYTPISFSGGILTRAIPEYTVHFKFVDENGEERQTTTSQTYSLDQLIYIEKNSGRLYASIQGKKIIIENIENVDNVSSEDKLNFILEHNSKRNTSICKGFLAIGIESMLIVFFVLAMLLAPRFLESFKMILPAVYITCIVLGLFCIKLLYKSIVKIVIKKKGVQFVADIEEIYDDRAVFNQRIHKRETQINRNSTHEFSFIRYSIQIEGEKAFFDEVLKPKTYVSLFGLSKVPICIYKKGACIDEDMLFIDNFTQEGVKS